MKCFILAIIHFLTRLAVFAQQVLLADSITQNPVSFFLYKIEAYTFRIWGTI